MASEKNDFANGYWAIGRIGGFAASWPRRCGLFRMILVM
jgi:hypothetical protein